MAVDLSLKLVSLEMICMSYYGVLWITKPLKKETKIEVVILSSSSQADMWICFSAVEESTEIYTLEEINAEFLLDNYQSN